MTTTPDPTPTSETPMPDPDESTPCNNPGHDHHLAHGLNCTDPMAWAKADDDIDPPADVVATPEPCAWRIRPDGECGADSTTVVWGDDHDEVRYVCAEHLPEAQRIGWTTDGPELPATSGRVSDPIARFRALSDAAGNPGAPVPTPGACICGPRGDGTGPYDGDPHPDCPEHGHVYGAAVDPSVFGHGMFAGYTTGPAPGPGVYEAAELARAAASHYGPDALPLYTGNLARYGTEHSRARTPGTPEGALSYALGHAEREGRTLLQARDVLAGLTELGWTLHPGLPHPAVLAQIHERLDRIEYVTENIAAAVDNPPPAARTLSAMGRVTDWDRTDTEHVIASVLTSGDRPGPVVHEDQAGDLAARIAEALYGPTTETTPGRGEEEPWPMCAHCGRTLRDCDCPPFEVTDEGAPTEGDDRRMPTGRILHVLDTCDDPDGGLTFVAIDDAVPGAPTSSVRAALDALVDRGHVVQFENSRGFVVYGSTDEPRTEGDG